MQIQWRTSHSETVRGTLDMYLLPAFNGKEVARITRADLLAFRSSLAKVTSRNGKALSASRINKIMTPLRMILNEAADRFQFTSASTNHVLDHIAQAETFEKLAARLPTLRAKFKRGSPSFGNDPGLESLPLPLSKVQGAVYSDASSSGLVVGPIAQSKGIEYF